MNTFTISDLERFSGIKAHTIRIWEKRYDALKPARSEGNTRYYDGSQLRRLLNIASLMNSDYKVSELCAMSDTRLNSLLHVKLSEKNPDGEADELLIAQIVAAALEFDEVKFEKIFSHCIIRYGVRSCYVKVIYPALQRLGLMWTNESLAPAQEHFITNLIRQKLDTAIDALPLADDNNKKWMLFLPENEFHEIGLLFAGYLIRAARNKVIYLGSNVPFDSLCEAVKITRPSSLLFFLVSRKDHLSDSTLLKKFSKQFPSQQLIAVSDAERLEKIKSTGKVTLISNVSELEKLL